MGNPSIPILTIPAKTETHTHTVVFLHGRGDNTKNFTFSLSLWRDTQSQTIFDRFPSFRWVFPQAPTREATSCSGAWPPQWFDVWNVRDFTDREEVQTEGLKQVVPVIRNIISDEAAALGGDWARVVLAGISMGAATGVHTLFNLNIPAEGGGRPGAFLGFSCRCPFAGRDLAGMRNVLELENVPESDTAVANTPVLLEHCADDPLVLLQNGQQMRDILRGFGAQVEWKEYSDGGHWFQSPNGVEDMAAFVNQHVLGTKSLNQSDPIDIS